MPRSHPADVDAVSWFTARFREEGSAERALWQKKYLKSELAFHGVTVPQLRAGVSQLLREHPISERAALLRHVRALGQTPFHDLRSAGLLLLEKRRKLLLPEDLPFLVELCRRFANWAHVDLVATKVIGFVVDQHPEARTLLRRWAQDESFWVRRTALLAQHDALNAGRGDFQLFAELAQPMLVEKEFFIRKALGWVLRAVSKKRPELTYAFLRQHRAALSGLTLREGAKHLPAKQREALGL